MRWWRSGQAVGLVVILFAAMLSGCAESGRSGEIIVTTNILGDVVTNIVGDAADVRVLMKPNADPHSFALNATDAARISSAGLVVHNGLGLEEGMGRHVDSAAGNGVPTLAVGEHIDPIPYADADNGGALDPHFWMDPERMLSAVDVITETISDTVAGIDAEALAANADHYRQQLGELADEMMARFGGIPVERRKLVTNHHVLGYLADRYRFTVIGAIVPGGTTLASPSSSDLVSLASAIESAGVPAIFVDSSQPDRLARVLADQAGVDVEIVELYTESLSPPGTAGATYLDMMRANTERIVTGLK